MLSFAPTPRLQLSAYWGSPYAFAGNTPIQAIDLDGAEIKKVVHYYDQHADGTKFVVKTDVEINQKGYELIDGKKYAVTNIIIVDQGRYYNGGTIYEPIVEGGLKPSAGYNYTQDVIDGKMTEDLEYIVSGTDDNFIARPVNVFNRDLNAPDNAMTVQDVNDLEEILDQVPKPNLLDRKKKELSTPD